jgi:hypothetical protein
MTDTATKYRQLYRLEKQVSAGFNLVYQIERGKTVRSDSLIEKGKQVIVDLTAVRNRESGRADKAEQALLPVQQERDKLKGRTWAGRLLRKTRNGLAYVGGASMIVLLLTLR